MRHLGTEPTSHPGPVCGPRCHQPAPRTCAESGGGSPAALSPRRSSTGLGATWNRPAPGPSRSPGEPPAGGAVRRAGQPGHRQCGPHSRHDPALCRRLCRLHGHHANSRPRLPAQGGGTARPPPRDDLEADITSDLQGHSVTTSSWTLATDMPDVPLRVIPAGTSRWVCSNCTTVHLHPSAGACINRECQRGTLREEPTVTDEGDYYGWLARRPVRRMAIAELTGTDRPARPAATPAPVPLFDLPQPRRTDSPTPSTCCR